MSGLSSDTQRLSQLRDWIASDTEPTETFPGLLWLDTSADPHVLKRRNDADDGWVTVGAAAGGGSVAVDDDGVEVVGEASRLNFGTGLSVSDDTGGAVTIDAAAAENTYVESVGDGNATQFDVTHQLGTLSPVVALWLEGELVLATVTVLSADTIRVDTAPTVVEPAALTVKVHAGDAEPEDLGEVEFAWVGGVE